MEKSNTLDDLKTAQQELIDHHKELVKCAEDLKEANDNLDIEEIEKEKRVVEVNNDLEDILFTVSHNIRKSVANILGISRLLCEDENLEEGELREMLTIIIESADSLNISTEELSKFIYFKKKGSSNNRQR
jgi:signal transduction histidine kinase